MIASSNFSEEGKNSAISFFSQVTLNTGVGEMLDVLLSKPGASVAETDVLAVSRYKTAYYTFVGPLLLGAILGGASKIQQAALETYGENLGIAFQLKDDIKDLFGSQASLKKEVGGDIKGGKTTVLIVKARAHANKKQQEILALYGNPSVTRKEIEAIKTVFVQTHALAYTESLAEDYGKRAQAFITTITKDEHMNSMLNDIINFVLKKEHYE
jgi:geranylgeranyl diphosphate synthase type I